MSSLGCEGGDLANIADVADTAEGLPSPPNLVRLCRRLTAFITIINEALADKFPFKPDLIERVVQQILEEGNSPLSVYEFTTPDPFDCGHALGVIAATIGGDEFRPDAKKRAKGCTCGTLLIPRACLPASIVLTCTPGQNRDFSPADHRHFNLMFQDKYELAQIILSGIQTRIIAWTFLKNENKTYCFQAVIAYSYCLSVFGKLDPSDSPATWRDGATLTAAEQIEILKHLADIKAVDSPLS